MKLVASVIIPTYKDWDDLECCLQALSKQDYPRELFEIIVVNNDIGVSVPKKFDTYKFVKFVSESKPGSYAARNRGISVSSGRVLAFTDSDCVPDKYWLRNGINSLAVEESKYSRIGGNVKLVFSGEITVSDDYERLFSFRQKEFC
jgi:glycosyltransferase involved in cell wall biosynthesis